jgi:hypothetical protein
VLVALRGSPVLEEIGEENLLGNLDDALSRARALLGQPAVERPVFAMPTVARETPTGGPRGAPAGSDPRNIGV